MPKLFMRMIASLLLPSLAFGEAPGAALPRKHTVASFFASQALAPGENLMTRPFEEAPAAAERRDLAAPPRYSSPQAEEGIRLYERGTYREAQPLLEKAIHLAPRDPKVLWRLASFYLHRSDVDGARRMIERALAALADLGPDIGNTTAIHTYECAARIFQYAGDMALAQSFAQQTVDCLTNQLTPGLRAEAHVLLGDFFMLAGQQPLAHREYEQALLVIPTHLEAVGGMLRLLIQQEDWPEALHLVARILPVSDRILMNDRPHGRATYAAITDIFRLASEVYLSSGRRVEAVRWIREAMILHYRTFGSEHPDGRSFLIRLAQDPRHLEEILASAESYLARVPDDHEALYYAGVAAFEAQKFPRCKQVISRLIEEHPELPYGWLLRSRLKRNDQESDGALADAERAAELAPKWADPYLIKALVFKQKRKPEAMLQAIKEARLRSPRNHQAAELYAEGLMLAGRFEEAVSELDRQILLDPWNTWPHLLKAQTLIEQGDPEAGLREARAHLHRSPKAGRLWAYVIQTLWMTGRRIEGETELDLAQAKYPGVRELNYLAAQGYDQFRRDMHRFMRRSVETGSFEELRGRFGYPSSESSPPKLPPDLGQNAWLKDKYQRLDPHPDLSVLQVPADAPFTIQRRDVRSYAMDILAMHRSDKFEVTGTHIGTTATFYTHSNKVLDTVESVIAYVESLLNFADGLGMRKDELLDPERVGFQNTRYEPGRPLQWVSTRVSIIFLDAQQNLFRNLLQELTKRYAQKLIKDAGAAHAYREVDSLSPLGRKIGLLARFVNNAYGVLDEEDKPLVQLPTMLVDELGHLIFARMRGYAENFGIMMPSPYLLAYDLGKNLINAAETRLPAFRELTEMHSDALGRLAKDNGPNQTIPFQRAVSDYRAEELLYRNPSQARAARLVWLLWAGLWDPHFYNSLTVENAPVDFDMERTLAPFLPVASIDLDIFTSQMVASFLQAETEAMDPYHRLSDFDLSIVAETIRRIQEFPDLAAIVKRNNFPSHAQFDGIRNPEDAFHYLDDKRSNQAAWLWRATAMTLMKLTGRSLTIDDLKTLCVRAGDSRLTNDAPRSAA